MSPAEANVIGWLQALCVEIGGPSGYEAAMAYFGGDESLDELAERLACPRSTLHRRLNRMWMRLEGCNALPPTWSRRSAGRPGATIITTGADLYRPSRNAGHFAGEGEDASQ